MTDAAAGGDLLSKSPSPAPTALEAMARCSLNHWVVQKLADRGPVATTDPFF